MLEPLNVILAVAGCISIVVVVAGCICDCRKDPHKNELVGTAGILTLHLEEEIESPTQISPLSAKRVSSQNSHRSLPEIPPPSVPRQDSGDTASGLYATVGANQRVSEQNSPIIARRSDHPYEHAYARLQDGLRIDQPILENEIGNANGGLPLSIIEESQSNSDGAVIITASNAISGQVSSSRDLPYMTPPVVTVAPVTAGSEEPVQRQPNQHFSGDSVDSASKGYTSISVLEPLSTIRTNLPIIQPQPHYATVSDDSDEMYAAIEEPASQLYTSGSETYAQIQPNIQPSPAVVESTSTAITTAQINPIITAPTVEKSNNAQIEAKDPIPKHSVQESSTSGHTSQKHIRQHSNSSNSDLIATLGSPKPEKRQANSPLPPPPPSSTIEPSTSNIVPHRKSQESPHHHKPSKHHKISSTGNLHDHDKLRRSLNEKHQRNNSCVSSSDFYGCNYPVDKHRFSSGDLVRPLVAKELSFSFDTQYNPKNSDAIYNTIDGSNDIYAAIDQEPSIKNLAKSQPNVMGSPIKNVEEMYAKVIKKSKHSTPDHRSQPSSRLSNYDDLNSVKIEQNYNNPQMRKKSLQQDSDRLSWSNETKRYSGNSPTNISQDAIKNNAKSAKTADKEDPGYETIDKMRIKSHGYETIEKNGRPHKDRNSDPGYETVKEFVKNGDGKKNKAIPTVSGSLMLQNNSNDGRGSPSNEPGYETVPSGPESLISNDPGYEHINRLEKYASDSDPNYEVLRSRNPTPPYASIRNKPQNSIPTYSVISKKSKASESNWMSNNNDFSSEPNYESMPHEAMYNTGSESDPNYESVGPKDPNYESVKYFDVSRNEPPYERVKSDKNSVQRTNSSSSYERVKPALKSDVDDKNDNRTSGPSLSYTQENASVGDYFQV